MNNLPSRKGIIIQEADKGSSSVILNKSDYIKRMAEISSHIDKLKTLYLKRGKDLNLLLKHEEKLVHLLTGIKKSIKEDLYKSLYPQGSQPGILYGLSEIYKPLINGFPKFRPVSLALKTYL